MVQLGRSCPPQRTYAERTREKNKKILLDLFPAVGSGAVARESTRTSIALTLEINRLRGSASSSPCSSSFLLQLAVALLEGACLDEDVLGGVPGVVADQQAREGEHQPLQHEHEGGVLSCRPANKSKICRGGTIGGGIFFCVLFRWFSIIRAGPYYVTAVWKLLPTYFAAVVETEVSWAGREVPSSIPC